MASQRLAGQRFRQRKLSVKQNLAIVRENEVETSFDDEARTHIPKVETGVEKAEEIVSLIIYLVFSHFSIMLSS
jgi:enhancer of polycomb-like protein